MGLSTHHKRGAGSAAIAQESQAVASPKCGPLLRVNAVTWLSDERTHGTEFSSKPLEVNDHHQWGK